MGSEMFSKRGRKWGPKCFQKGVENGVRNVSKIIPKMPSKRTPKQSPKMSHKCHPEKEDYNFDTYLFKMLKIYSNTGLVFKSKYISNILLRILKRGQTVTKIDDL